MAGFSDEIVIMTDLRAATEAVLDCVGQDRPGVDPREWAEAMTKGGP